MSCNLCGISFDLCSLFLSVPSFPLFFLIIIYRYRLSICEVSLQEFPVWGPRPLTRLNLPFQMKAAQRERQCCLAEQQSLAFRQQECGMSGVGVRKRGKNAKYVHVCPGLAFHSAPSDVLQGPASIKGAALCSQNSDPPLPKLNSSFYPKKETKTVAGAAV